VQGSGRAHWLIAFAQTRLSNNDASRTAALHAAALARQAGDLLGLANALNVLSFSCADIAERLQVLRQAAEAFERAGNQFGRSMVLGNLSLTFAELGLWRHACRLGEQCMSIAKRIGARLNVALEMGAVLKWQIDLGDLASARARWSTYDALVSSLDEPVTGNDRELWAAEMQVAEGNTAGALKRLRNFQRRVREHNPGFQLYVQIPLARVLLQRGDAAAALRATQRGIALLRERGFARTGFGQSQDIWWWHSRALAALGRDDEAWAALQQAHGLMLVAVRNLHDEGLRRSYLNKLLVNRALVPAWLAEAARRGVPDAQRLDHLRLASSLADPFKRLVDSGLRLNQLRSEAALHDFLIDELTELSGAERVLLVLEGAGTRHIAGALLPKGEDKEALLQAVTPWLDEAAATREPLLRHGPEGAAPEHQRSCLVAPLVAQGELLGHVYADIEGAFGRFGEADRDLLAMLAALAAVALANLRFAGGLEAQVAERTAEARTAQAQAEQRASELAVINSIQQGMAAQLDFQAIVNLAGDKLREVFATGDIGIRIVDGSGSQIVAPYFYSRGVRHDAPAMPVAKLRPGGAMDRVLHGETLVARNRAEQAALGVRPVPGVEQSHSFVTVPIKAGDRVVGGLTLENMQRENAFGEPEVRLLETVAASMGVAMENARLFKATQDALQQQTATAEVLQVISSSVADAQPVLDKILESCRQLIDAQVLVILLVGEDGRLHVGGTRVIGLDGHPGWSQAEMDARIERMRSVFPMTLEGTGTALAIASGRALNYPDVLHGADVPEGVRAVARQAGHNYSQMQAPLMQGEVGIGSIILQRAALGGFTPKEEALLKTFADQAVIAIQNAKMFRETNEALERQTATAEVLQVISASVADTAPVFDKILDSCQRVIACTDL
nr:GAF domain-containing protein [Burkholderiaceae bacterium]